MDQLSVTPGTEPLEAPLSMGFSRQEYWCGLPFPTPEEILDPGVKPAFLVSPVLKVDSLPLCHLGRPHSIKYKLKTYPTPSSI